MGIPGAAPRPRSYLRCFLWRQIDTGLRPTHYMTFRPNYALTESVGKKSVFASSRHRHGAQPLHTTMGIDQVAVRRSRMSGSLHLEHRRTRNIVRAQFNELFRWEAAQPEVRIRMLNYFHELSNGMLQTRIDQAREDAIDDFFEEFRFTRQAPTPAPVDPIIPIPRPIMTIAEAYENQGFADDDAGYDTEETERPRAVRRLNFESPSPARPDPDDEPSVDTYATPRLVCPECQSTWPEHEIACSTLHAHW